MKTEITPKDYINIYEACDWNPILFSKALKALRYSDELIVNGDLDLIGTPIQSLKNLQEVGGNLDLMITPIQSLGNLQKVGGYLDLYGTPIQSLGNLKTVGGWLDLRGTPISKKYSEEEIRQMVKVKSDIYL